jgi:hypothetical protein
MTPSGPRFFPVSILVFRRTADWIATAIELNLTEKGPSASGVITALLDRVGHFLCSELEAGRHPGSREPDDALGEAFHDVMRAGTATSDPESYQQVAVATLFTVEPGENCLATSHMQGLPVGANLDDRLIRRLAARVHSAL